MLQVSVQIRKMPAVKVLSARSCLNITNTNQACLFGGRKKSHRKKSHGKKVTEKKSQEIKSQEEKSQLYKTKRK